MEDTRREQIIECIEKEFIGPDPIDWPGRTQENGEEVLITDPPRVRYIAGILYPRDTQDTDLAVKENEIKAESGYEQDVVKNLESEKKTSGDSIDYLEAAEELINRSNAYRQSAMSITVAIQKSDSIKVDVTAGIYKSSKIANDDKNSVVYNRSSLSWNNADSPLLLPNSKNSILTYPIDNTGLQFDITYRYTIKNHIIYTFTLENTKEKIGNSVRDEDCFFQTRFKIFSENGFVPLPEGTRVTKDEDYLSNKLLYRSVYNYAVGHGCATDWDDGETVQWISTATFPKYDIKPIVPNKIEGVSLEMRKMGPDVNFSEAIQELRLMCEKYREWINRLKITVKDLSKEYELTADRHISSCEECLRRMEKGVDLLQENLKVRQAFQYMNLAMLMQQLHYNLPMQHWKDDGTGILKLSDAVQLPDVDDDKTWYGNKERYGKWRPFQLAFVLMNLKSMYDEKCTERSIVDLIWFPTGGGKTEAYLGLSAYTIFIRRLKNKEDDGTAILMRYTLRLLTAQQYERASSMICACEIIRREHVELFGTRIISIGLWVGASTTPNTVSNAVKAFEELQKGKGSNPFIILKCPWCGAQMGLVQKGKGVYEVPGYRKSKGPRRTNHFSFRCSNTEHHCEFSNVDLPLYVVDETIYKEKPTLLLGTVDKFAMLPFKPEAQALFGYKNGKKISSPDLIIQDELHLISGPLGSMVGHYETLINELCTTRTDAGEIHPKIIASTATISRAKEQCHALYGCPKESVFQFPPSGLDAGDSFFAVEDKSKNGRRYVGILATGSSSDATTAIRLFASLLYSAKAIKVEKEEERDPYWTNIGYYNSIRELGQAATWIKADIDQHLDVMYKRRHDDKRYSSIEEYRQKRRYIWRDEELTSRITGSEVTASLSNLGLKYTGEKDEDGKTKIHPIDICLATNMISVGLDIPRLGLMTVVGQPKTTSEYIQATSRVGRDSDNAPGLVFVLYRPGRPRDKSHYEHFKSYHSRVYCNVEPTSVTPFSSPVRDRALHAIMIGILRLQGSDEFNEDPPKMADGDTMNRLFDIVANRVEDIDPNELDDTIARMEYIIKSWENWNPSIWEPKKNPDWSYADAVPLMYYSGTQPNISWGGRGLETPTSMRNVDASCEAFVLTNSYVSKEE